MPDLGFSIDPVNALDMTFDFSGNQKRADQQIAHSEQQRMLDNKFRTQQYIDSRSDLIRERDRQDTYLTRLRTDADRAGIGINAALGNQGYTPQNISIPGQGGRVAGRYQQKSIPEMKATMKVAAKRDHLNTLLLEEQILKLKAENSLTDMHINQMNIENLRALGYLQKESPNLYIAVRDNTEEARKWQGTDNMVALPNPDLGVELPETVGFGYWSAPRMFPGGESPDPQPSPSPWGIR